MAALSFEMRNAIGHVALLTLINDLTTSHHAR